MKDLTERAMCKFLNPLLQIVLGNDNLDMLTNKGFMGSFTWKNRREQIQNYQK